jgi:hypothetical protein
VVVRGAKRGPSQMRGAFERRLLRDVCWLRLLGKAHGFGGGDRGASTCFVHCFNFLHLRLAVSRRFFERLSRGKRRRSTRRAGPEAQSVVEGRRNVLSSFLSFPQRHCCNLPPICYVVRELQGLGVDAAAGKTEFKC